MSILPTDARCQAGGVRTAPAPAPKSPAAPVLVPATAVAIPLTFILTGLGALLAALVGLVAHPHLLATYHYNQHIIALTHLLALGWLTTVGMGVVYQLVPVALQTRLYSERLAGAQFALHVVGCVGMVWMFWRWDMKQVGHYGSALAFGVGLFAYNLARTLARAPRWDVVAGAVAAALFWLSGAVLVGLSVAAAKCSYESAARLPSGSLIGAMIQGLAGVADYVKRFDQMSVMHAHAHLGGLGVFLMLLVGVSYKLIPMFTLSAVQSRRRAVASVALLNIGLGGVFVTMILRSPWKAAFALVIVAGLAIYGLELRGILRARKRPALDGGLRQFLTAAGLLVPVSLVGLVLSWPGLPLTAFTGQLETLYGTLALLGVVSFAILGMLYKIVPFLVWYGRYSREVGRRPVPSFSQLYSERLQTASFWLYLAGLVALGASILTATPAGVRAGALILTASVTLFALNVARMLAHFFKPSAAEPTPPPADRPRP